ncbi:MAG: hypothetical protein N2712_08025, partial [Brevinematales bacterium]|nr:hypothetical protein [Brevinematales bacterium]
MADRLQVVYEIQAKVDKFEEAINKTKNSLKSVGQEINNVNKTGKAGFGGLGGIAGSLSSVFSKLSVAIIGVAGAIQSLRQGIESLVVLKQLEVALKNAGFAGNELRETLNALSEEADKLSNIMGIDDEAIIKMYQLGIQMGLTVDQTKELTKVSLNVARAFGLDFETAMTQVVRVLQTGETFLTRYDSRLKALIETKADNAKIVEHLTKTYGGMAEEVGKIDVMQKVITQFNNLIEQLGITLYPVVSAVLG